MSHSINILALLTTHDTSLNFSLQKALLKIFSLARTTQWQLQSCSSSPSYGIQPLFQIYCRLMKDIYGNFLLNAVGRLVHSDHKGLSAPSQSKALYFLTSKYKSQS